jgi:hypothetical protein
MNKFFVSVGLAAAGTAGLQVSSALALDMQSSKLWTVSASLRGFYDDNYDTATQKKGSFGFEVSPQIAISVPLQQTEFGLRYTYGLYYYQNREEIGDNPIDQSHQVDLWLDHSFTERWEAKLSDTLAVGQEPQLLNVTGGATTEPIRVNGNNIANSATLSLHTDWTRLFSTQVTLSDGFYDFENSGATLLDVVPTNLGGTGNGASLAGTLNRLDNSGALDLQWHVAPETMLFVGYQYEQVNYTGNEPIAYSPLLFATTGNAFYYSNSRDSRSHYGYLGFQHSFLANLNFNGKAGIQYVEDYNDPLSSASVSPYVALSVVYTYLPGCYAQLGFNHGQNATDVVAVNQTIGGPQFGRLTQAQESSSAFLSINHRITPKLMGTIIGNFQYSEFTSGQYVSQPDIDYNLGLNLKYSFNEHFSAEVGYNFDDLQSGIDGRAYDRNRVYLGLGASY